MGALYALTITSFFEKHGWVPYLDLNADASGAVLRLLGQDVTVSGRAISSTRASLLIERGCDAIHPSALFISAIVAAPTSVRRKLFGMVAGTSLLMVTNLIRIVSLFYVRMYWPDAFRMMHIEVWQALFIFLALLLWVVWARWAVRDRTGGGDAVS
jgi:exosortase H (IPTLxxWG-CTERM-specific)